MANLILGTNNTEPNLTTLTTTGILPTLGVDHPRGTAISVTSGGGNAVMITALGSPIVGALGVDTQGDAVHVATRKGGTGITVEVFAGRGDGGPATGTGIVVNSRSSGTGIEVLSATGIGVQVFAPQDDGIDVTAGDIGVFASSSSSAGVFGSSDKTMGVLGIGKTFGGVFWGGLLCASGAKNAAVMHPDGMHRLLHSLESPESWFEDFGRAKLVRGRVLVTIDPTFVAVVRGDSHIFLSPEGECNGLYVKRRTRSGFEVREQGNGTSGVAFSYRIVARRKDIKAPRFQKIKLENPKELLAKTRARTARKGV